VGALMTVTSSAIFGTLAILAKIGYGAGLHPDQMLCLRFLMAAVAMTIFELARRGGALLRLDMGTFGKLVALGLFGYAGQSILFYSALRTLPASLTELLFYLYPSLVVILAWRLYRRRVSRLHVAALAATFAGIVLLIGGVALAITNDLVFAMATPIFYAAYVIVAERLTKGIPAFAASVAVMWGAALAWTALAIWSRHLLLVVTPTGWAVILLLALGPSMAAIPLMLGALSRIDSSRFAVLSTVEPVVTVILAMTILGERLTLIQLCGAAIVLGAVVALQREPQIVMATRR
jgi:drug/metabolite transporter (DMT)-like permease